MEKILLRVFRSSSSRMNPAQFNPVTKSSHRHNDLSGLSLTIGQLCSIQFVCRVFSTLVIVMRAKLWHCIKHAEGKEENAQIPGHNSVGMHAALPCAVSASSNLLHQACWWDMHDLASWLFYITPYIFTLPTLRSEYTRQFTRLCA